MKKAAFYTLGCKVNQYETEAMAELFADSGYEIKEFTEVADVYVINTCSVTNMGDRKSRQIIRRAKKLNPNAVIAVTGCYAQTAPDEVLAIEGVNLVLGTKDRKNIVTLVEELNTEYYRRNYDYEQPPLIHDKICRSHHHTSCEWKLSSHLFKHT